MALNFVVSQMEKEISVLQMEIELKKPRVWSVGCRSQQSHQINVRAESGINVAKW